MRRLIYFCSFIVPLTALTSAAFSQQTASDVHQIGLIDMAHVFKNYEKFKSGTQALQDEVAQRQSGLTAKVEEGKRLQQQMKEYNVGSPEFEKLEGELVNLQAELKKIQLKNQREFMKREADLYKEIYLEVYEAVNRYARYYKYTLIMRFERAGLAAAENPQDIVEGLNQQVLYHRNRDDLTDPILNYLNEKWRRQNQSAAAESNGTTN